MLSLTHFRSKAKGVSDLFNHLALVADGVIQLKDGALLAGYFFSGEDTASSTASRRNLISARVNRALARLGDEYATTFDAVRMPVSVYSPREASHFADPISALVDEARRERALAQGQHYVTQQVLTIKYKPPSKRQSWLAKQFYDGGLKQVGRDLDRHLETFAKSLQQLEDDLLDVLEMTRMESYEEVEPNGRTVHRDELLNYVNFCVSGNAPAINVPATGMYLDTALGGNALFNGHTPKLGNQYIAVVGIEGFPAETWPGVLDVLNHMAIPYRASYRFIHLEQHTALALLKKNRLRWEQQIRPFMDQLMKNQSGRINEDAAMMANEVRAAETDAQSALVSFGYATPVIVLMDEDLGRVQENARIVAAEIAKLGFNTRVETENALQAWLGSLPGHTHENIRRPLLHTLAWADMAPLSTVWPGNRFNPSKLFPPQSPPLFLASTTGATPFWLNFHVDDLGHTLVLGPTGSGKSVLLAYSAMSWRRYRDATIVVFDKGGSMEATVKACGGHHFDMSPDGLDTPKLCPLKYIDTAADALKAQEVIEVMYSLAASVPVTPEQRALIRDAINTLRTRKTGRSLGHFINMVQDKPLREALRFYTEKGLGEMLGADADEEPDMVGRDVFSVFEMEELLNMGEKATIPALLVIFDRVERAMVGQPTLVIVDEGWVVLANPLVRDKIIEYLRVFRKANGVVLFATQSLADVAESGIVGIFNESCPTKIFLANPEADRSADLYGLLGCNEREVEIITQAQRKRDYYIAQPNGRRLIQLALDPLTLAFVGASSKEDRKRVEQLVASHGDAWPYRWLEERGVSYRHLLSQQEVRHAA